MPCHLHPMPGLAMSCAPCPVALDSLRSVYLTLRLRARLYQWCVPRGYVCDAACVVSLRCRVAVRGGELAAKTPATSTARDADYLLDADYLFGQNMTEHNPAPSPSGHPLLSGPPTVTNIHQIFTVPLARSAALRHRLEGEGARSAASLAQTLQWPRSPRDASARSTTRPSHARRSSS